MSTLGNSYNSGDIVWPVVVKRDGEGLWWGLGLESPRGAFIIPPLLHTHTHTRTLTRAQQVLVSPK